MNGVTKDYIKVRYAKNDTLYVPVTQLDLVSKYIGPREDSAVKLNRLGGADWQRQKAKVRSAVKDIAKELIQLYAQRMQQKGFAFPRTGSGSTTLNPTLSLMKLRTSCGASTRSRTTWSGMCPWTGFCAGTWALARPKWPAGGV